MAKKTRTITVLNEQIRVTEEDYISLTDMLKSKEGDFFISDWLRNRNTVEYLGIWERVHNPDFNYGEFAIIKSQAGLNSYKISVKEWVAKTNAIGLRAKAGRYGGTYAHKDIAFEFGMWISAEFKIYLIKEFQRLQDEERKRLGWHVRRDIAKINYRIHTDAIKENLIPETLSNQQISYIYASEADILNVALFGKTAKQWRIENPDKEGNMRDYANVSQLVCLANRPLKCEVKQQPPITPFALAVSPNSSSKPKSPPPTSKTTFTPPISDPTTNLLASLCPSDASFGSRLRPRPSQPVYAR